MKTFKKFLISLLITFCLMIASFLLTSCDNNGQEDFMHGQEDFILGLPINIAEMNKYKVIPNAHTTPEWFSGGNGSGVRQTDNDAIHIHPKELNEFIIIYTPLSGKIVELSWGKIQNEQGQPENHYINLSIQINLKYTVHFSIEGYYNDNVNKTLQNELIFVENGQTVAEGDALLTCIYWRKCTCLLFYI